MRGCGSLSTWIRGFGTLLDILAPSEYASLGSADMSRVSRLGAHLPFLPSDSADSAKNYPALRRVRRKEYTFRIRKLRYQQQNPPETRSPGARENQQGPAGETRNEPRAARCEPRVHALRTRLLAAVAAGARPPPAGGCFNPRAGKSRWRTARGRARTGGQTRAGPRANGAGKPRKPRTEQQKTSAADHGKIVSTTHESSPSDALTLRATAQPPKIRRRHICGPHRLVPASSANDA